MAVGVIFSVKADLGVSPVASLSYSISLITPISLGVATLCIHVLFILAQIVILKKIELKKYASQLLVVIIFSSFLDLTMWLARNIPIATILWLQAVYLVLSLVTISIAIFFYLFSRLPLMPYESLVPALYTAYKINVGRAKVICDVLIVSTSLILCLVFLRSFGAVGIGTIVSAYLVGIILGGIAKRFQAPLDAWIDGNVTDQGEEREEQKAT